MLISDPRVQPHEIHVSPSPDYQQVRKLVTEHTGRTVRIDVQSYAPSREFPARHLMQVFVKVDDSGVEHRMQRLTLTACVLDDLTGADQAMSNYIDRAARLAQHWFRGSNRPHRAHVAFIRTSRRNQKHYCFCAIVPEAA